MSARGASGTKPRKTAARPGLAARAGDGLLTFWGRLLGVVAYGIVGALVGSAAAIAGTALSRPVGDALRASGTWLETAVRDWPELAVGALLGIIAGVAVMAIRRL